ncbi:MAG TPA: pyridoxamine 5'-phosphate oxidase family protein [Thermoanaerobaculia bacterium]|nr:pyridoxamine 5'-phosphate oxidase family protein [Thermoanaerobaculia bacterium]
MEKLYELIDKIEIAMFTTRRADGKLVSRPMATQRHAEGAHLWFVTDRSSEKLVEIGADPHVNLGYFRDLTKEWVSVSGLARIVDDRAKIHELYAPDWRAWFGDEGGEKDGTPDDPRIVLIGVQIELALYLSVNKPQPVVLFDVVKGIVTGNRPDVGEVKEVKP